MSLAEAVYSVFRTVLIVSEFFFLLIYNLFQFDFYYLLITYFDFLDLGKIVVNLPAFFLPISLVDSITQSFKKILLLFNYSCPHFPPLLMVFYSFPLRHKLAMSYNIFTCILSSPKHEPPYFSQSSLESLSKHCQRVSHRGMKQ